MSKRKAAEGLPFGAGGGSGGKAVRFDDNVTESEEGLIGPGLLPGMRPKGDGEEPEIAAKKQHTLDSDEEDDEEEAAKYDVLKDDDIEGQEEGTLEFDDGEKITPFNMREEMEEGHFDKEGNYHFKKDSEIKDAWLDNVDWRRIRQKEMVEKDSDDEEDEASNLEDYTPSVIGWKEKIPLYEEMITIMHPGENVFKAIKRLGGEKGKSASASSKWAKKRKESESEAMDTTKDLAKEASNQAAMLRLTALADQLLQSGDLGVYESSTEKLKHDMERNKSVQGAAAASVNLDDDDALDMFADEIDADKLEKRSAETDKTQTNGDNVDGVPQDFSHEVQWWYRWEKRHDTEEHGPYPSTQMKTWTELGYFPEGVWLRKNDQTVTDDLENLYNSKRIDFELYT